MYYLLLGMGLAGCYALKLRRGKPGKALGKKRTLPTLTIGVITYNEEASIERCLASCGMVNHQGILVVDSLSTDKTVDLARNTATVISNKFQDYASQRNLLIDSVSTDYILMLDADEEITPELAAGINAFLEREEIQGAYVNRRCIFNGQTLKYTFQPDRCLKLFRRRADRRYTGIVHETLTNMPAELPVLPGWLNHYSYKDVPHYFAKLNQYAELDGRKAHKHRSVYFLPLSALHGFLKFYFLKLGFLDGLNGLFFAIGHALYLTLKGYYYIRYTS